MRHENDIDCASGIRAGAYTTSDKDDSLESSAESSRPEQRGATGDRPKRQEISRDENVANEEPENAQLSVPRQSNETTASAIVLPAPAPICKLSYYHGAGRCEDLVARVPMKGDFLLFLNTRDNHAPTLLIRDDQDDVNMITVGRADNECFYFMPSDLEYRFTSIGRLIAHYYSTPHTDNPMFKRSAFRNPIKCKEYDDYLLLERNDDMKTWLYRLPADTRIHKVDQLLLETGDYVLVADEPSHNMVFIRWNDEIKTVSFKKNNRGQWELPRMEAFEPTEMVRTLDQLIKSLAAIRHVLYGVCLIKPVKANSDIRCTADVQREAQDNSGHDTNAKMYAPRPLHALPSYMGKTKTNHVLPHLKETGNYAIFVDKEGGNVYLATCIIGREEKTYRCMKIKKTKSGYFILQPSDLEWMFGTVEELVEHYRSSRAESDMSMKMYAPRPMHAHRSHLGKAKLNKVFAHLRKTGNYVIFVDREDGNVYLATCIVEREEKVYRCNKIKKTENGYYVLQPSDSDHMFGTAEELVEHYRTLRLPVQTPALSMLNKAYVHESVNKDIYAKEFKVFQSSDPAKYRWNHLFLNDAKVSRKLKRDGDYLLRVAENKRDFLLTVRWNNNYYDLSVEPDKGAMYELTRSDPSEPTEYTNDFHDYLKSCVHGMSRFNQIVLKRCIPTDRRRYKHRRSNSFYYVNTT